MTCRTLGNTLAKRLARDYDAAMRQSILLLLLLAAGCAPRDLPANDSMPSPIANADNAALTPGAQPVTIGEAGPGLAACVARGRIVNLSPASQPYLPVRAAPFTEAHEVARLQNGARVFVCTRSIDQAWRGVVIPPDGQPDADCGVRAPVASAQVYGGPCRSGWVATAFLEQSAD